MDGSAGAKLAVVQKTMHLWDEPELHLLLSDGSTVRIRWDLDYSHRLLSVAHGDEDFAACTADQTGLSEDVLEPLVDEVYEATRLEEHERVSSDCFYGSGL